MKAQISLTAALMLLLSFSLLGCGKKDSEAADGEQRKLKIVFVTGDEEYRSEDSMPMLAAILERDFPVTCSVAYALSDEGEVDPNRKDNIDGLEELDDADLMVVFTRFRQLPDDQLKRIRDFAGSGKPMVGFRTATHAFRYPNESPNVAMNDDWPIAVFGQKWITHHGHFADGQDKMTEVTIREEGKEHPILRGVKPFGVYSWLYHVEGGGDELPANSKRLLDGRALRSNHEKNLERFPRTSPVAWTRSYESEGGEARIFFTTLGHPFDFKQDDMRRLALNGIVWALGLEELIPEEGCRTDFASTYDPPNSGFGQVYRKGNFPRRK